MNYTTLIMLIFTAIVAIGLVLKGSEHVGQNWMKFDDTHFSAKTHRFHSIFDIFSF